MFEHNLLNKQHKSLIKAFEHKLLKKGCKHQSKHLKTSDSKITLVNNQRFKPKLLKNGVGQCSSKSYWKNNIDYQSKGSTQVISKMAQLVNQSI